MPAPSRLQEDAHVATLNFDGREDVAFFGVYDGHGGAQVAKFCAMHMPDELKSNTLFKKGEIQGALQRTYLAIDDRLRLKENAELLNQLKAKSSVDGSNGISVVDPGEDGAMCTCISILWLGLRSIHSPATPQ